MSEPRRKASKEELEAYQEKVRAQMRDARTKPVNLRGKSLSQRRMILQGLVGQRVMLQIVGLHARFDVEIVGFGSDLDALDPGKILVLIGKATGEDNRWVTAKILQIHEVQPMPWPMSDPRNPNYEKP